MPIRASAGHAALGENVPPSSPQAASSMPIVSDAYSSHFDVFLTLLQLAANAAPDLAPSCFPAASLLPQPAPSAPSARMKASDSVLIVVLMFVSVFLSLSRTPLAADVPRRPLARAVRVHRALPLARDALGVVEVLRHPEAPERHLADAAGDRGLHAKDLLEDPPAELDVLDLRPRHRLDVVGP